MLLFNLVWRRFFYQFFQLYRLLCFRLFYCDHYHRQFIKLRLIEYTLESYRDILGVAHTTNENDGDGKGSIVRKGGPTDKLRSGYRKQERRYREINTEYHGDQDDDY